MTSHVSMPLVWDSKIVESGLYSGHANRVQGQPAYTVSEQISDVLAKDSVSLRKALPPDRSDTSVPMTAQKARELWPADYMLWTCGAMPVARTGKLAISGLPFVLPGQRVLRLMLSQTVIFISFIVTGWWPGRASRVDPSLPGGRP